MKYFNRLIIILLWSIYFLMPQFIAYADPEVDTEDGWSELRPGISYKKIHVENPRDINVFLARMDRSVISATIDTGMGKGLISGGLDTVSEIAKLYDQAINYWLNNDVPSPKPVWGNRNEVVIAINGYFYGDPHELDGIPWSGQIHSGWYAKRFTNYEGDDPRLSYDVGFGWGLDRIPFVGSCIDHIPDKQRIQYLEIDKSQKFDGINRERGNEEIIIYTPQYGLTTGTDDSGIEILVELTRPLIIIPEHAPVRGYVRDIRKGDGSTLIPYDHIVLSGKGDKANIMVGNVEIGDVIGISQELTPCGDSPDIDYTNTYASMGGDYHFLNNGIVRTDYGNDLTDPYYPNSRTAVVFNTDYIYFLVLDKCNENVSEGMTIPELGNFAKDSLGAEWGVTLDSGGSSTMVVLGDVVNDTISNNIEYQYCPIPDGFTHSMNDEKRSGEYEKSEVSSANILGERTVANALMMISNQQKNQSTRFYVGEVVTTTVGGDIYQGPGTNFQRIDTISGPKNGLVLPTLNDMNGVFAKGQYWWKVEFDKIAGWFQQVNLTFTPSDWQYLPMISNQE